MNLPDQVAVMPLPNAILFPRVMLPLYIFEPRYKEMLAACLEGDRMFAVALLRKGWERQGRNPASYPVATVGLITNCVAKPDGTSNLVLEGIQRVRICRYVRRRPYPVADIKPLSSFGAKPSVNREPLKTAISRLARVRVQRG